VAGKEQSGTSLYNHVSCIEGSAVVK